MKESVTTLSHTIKSPFAPRETDIPEFGGIGSVPLATMCLCGGAGRVPQIRVLRVPGTFSACVYQVFCMGGCHREGVGMTESQAIERWNDTIEKTK